MRSFGGLVRDVSRAGPAERHRRDSVTSSALYGGHVRLVMALTGGRGEIVERFDLLSAQLDAVGSSVRLDAGDTFGAGDRSDVVALREQPGQRDLRRRG